MSATYHLFLDQFGATEWLPRAELHRYQERRLARILLHADRTAEFYRGQLAGIVHGDEELDWTAWRGIPILSRQDLEEHGHRLLSAMVPDDHGAIRFVDDGDPGGLFAVAWTDYKALTEECLRIRLLAWQDINPGQSLAAIEAAEGETETESRYWNKAFRELNIPGRRIDLPKGLNAQAVLAAILDWGCQVVESSAEAISDLCEEVQGTGTKLALSAVIITGLPPSDGLRKRCRRALGVEPVAAYEVRGIGTLALECKTERLLHQIADTCYVEILDAQGAVAKPGFPGRVIVTPFYNFAMPLIRYDTGDTAIQDVPCACGRSLPTLSRIQSRADSSGVFGTKMLAL